MGRPTHRVTKLAQYAVFALYAHTKTFSLEVQSFTLWQPKQDILEYFTVHSSNCNTRKETISYWSQVVQRIKPALEAMQLNTNLQRWHRGYLVYSIRE